MGRLAITLGEAMKKTEWGDTLKLEASFGLDRIVKNLNTSGSVTSAVLRQLVRDTRKVSKLLRESVIDSHKKEEGMRIIELQRIAAVRPPKSGGFRRKYHQPRSKA